VIQGGRPELQGTWIHPRLAVDLARWICPSFAVWMDGWFLESLGMTQPAPPAPQPPSPRHKPQPRSLREVPMWASSQYLPSLICQRWLGDPEANDIIRGIAQHLLLSCDPLPTVAAVEGEALAWYRALKVRTGQPAW